jgi:hypothetical protein
MVGPPGVHEHPQYERVFLPSFSFGHANTLGAKALT